MDLTVHHSSYPGARAGDQRCEVRGTTVRYRRAGKCAGRNASEVRAGPESRDAVAELPCNQRRPTQEPEQPFDEGSWAAGVLGTARTQGVDVNVGDLSGRFSGPLRQLTLGVGPIQESEGLIVPTKPAKAGGGKGPWFRYALEGVAVRRLT